MSEGMTVAQLVAHLQGLPYQDQPVLVHGNSGEAQWLTEESIAYGTCGVDGDEYRSTLVLGIFDEAAEVTTSEEGEG